ncbi:hypothetical protein [Massilia psychrophila]|uniref:DUF2306 domain-containing protein n=1 Tax=Massilia psychrophila TaxID=1603353 RepID=A0A2G8SYD4_9BURK|nr:hypothetical protein [Massilia psychrophila]PIL38488.1 hypothetical protein CR103_17850 [Massilia psychrophila]GGE89347.1 hypothetical protein GCM10008020_37970 [Massilia psychrophila]
MQLLTIDFITTHFATLHLLNIGFHVGSGVAAIALGFVILATTKGTERHRRRGRRFGYLTLAVCASAVAGNLLFRFIPLFAILTVLVLYQFLGAWRAVVTRANGPSLVDAALSTCAATAGFILAPVVSAAPGGSSAVVHSSLATLAVVIGYDIARWLFPPHWHGVLWRYEHVYKSVASLFAMLSAASGNAIRFGQPYSQLLPSALGIGTIAWLLWRTWRRQQRRAIA